MRNRGFWVFFGALLAYRVLYIIITPLQLSPEEAYYWSYARHPAMGYFDHPPMVAWVIYLFTKVFGDTVFAIRIGAVLLTAGTTYLVYLIGLKLFSFRAGLLGAVILNVAFVFNIYATGITPDTPLFFFWALGVYLYLLAWKSEGYLYWVLAGAAAGGALLSKYTGAFLPASMLVFLVLERGDADRWKKYIVSGITALLVFSPVIIWNMQHGFASFAFQTTERASTNVSFSPWMMLSNFLGGVGFQAAFLSLFLFGGMVYVLVKVSRLKEKSFGQRFLLGMSLPTLLFFLAISPIAWVKTNWPTPGYIAALLLMGAYVDEHLSVLSGSKVAKSFGTFALGFGVFMVILAQVQPFRPGILPALSKANTMSGWRELSARVSEVRGTMPDPENVFITGHGYQIASELSFYGFRDGVVYSSNVFGERALAYDFWQPDLSHLVGKDAVVVAGKFEEFHLEAMERHFECFDELELYVLEIAGVKVREFRIFRGYGYLGKTGRDRDSHCDGDSERRMVKDPWEGER